MNRGIGMHPGVCLKSFTFERCLKSFASKSGVHICAALLAAFVAVSGRAEEMHPTAVEEPLSYIDDDDHRPLADLRFAVDEQHPGSLKLTISAIGPGVDPIAGFRGIQGANRYTAEELGLLLDGTHPVEVLTTSGNGDVITGRLDPGEFGRLPERRLGMDGRIRFLSTTELDYPLNVHVRAESSGAGTQTTIVKVSERSRLRVRYQIRDGRVDVLELQSLGGDHLAARDARPPAERQAFMLAVQKHFPQPTKSIIDWRKRDLEGRWVAIQSDIAKHPGNLTNWVLDLAQREEFELLEWLAIAQPDAYKSHEAGELLQAKEAPQWIRVTVWNLGQSRNFGHGATQANQLLLHKQPGIVEDWLQRHVEMPEREYRADDPNAPPQGMSGPGKSLVKIYRILQDDKVPPADSSAFSPPLNSDEIFRPLAAPLQLVDFGKRTTAEPGVVYLHQVLRAINAVVVSGQYNSEVLPRLNQLLEHPHPRVRQEVCLAHTHIVDGLQDTSLIPGFDEIFDNVKEVAAVREAALMAHSYRAIRNPLVELTLLRVAADETHPGWAAAVSRLGELLPAAGEALLDVVPADSLAPSQKSVLAAARRSIRQRKTTTRHYHHATARAAVLSLEGADAKQWTTIAQTYAASVKKGNVASVRPYEFDELPVTFEQYAARFRKIHQAIVAPLRKSP